MTININKLLKKNTWTGEEVGRALLASLVYDAKHYVFSKDEDYKPLFTQEDFNRMIGSLHGEQNREVYSVFLELHNSIKETYNRAMMYPQVFYHGYYRFSNIVSTYRATEEALELASRNPLIVTASQYERLKQEAKATLEGFTESFASLILHAIEYFYTHEDEAPAKITAAIEALGDELITRERVLKERKLDLGGLYGYYVLPDGRRSDEMTPEEWEQAKQEHYLKAHTYIVDGVKQGPEETLKHYKFQALYEAQRIFYYGMEGIKAAWMKAHPGETFPQFTREQEKTLLEALESEATVGVIWNEQEIERDVPRSPYMEAEDFIKYEVIAPLTDNLGLEYHPYEGLPETPKNAIFETISHNYYPVDTDGTIEDKQIFKEFTEDYPELYKVVADYVRAKIPAAKKLKPTQYTKGFITWGELAKKGFPGYDKLTTPNKWELQRIYWDKIEETEDNYMKIRQIFHGGVAIIEDPSHLNLEENGDYKAKDPLSRFDALEELGKEQQDHINLIKENLIYRGYSYLTAFNTLVEIIGRVYDIDEAENLKLPAIDIMESQVNALNMLIYSLHAHVFGSPAERAKKRAIIRATLQPIDLESLKPTNEAIQAVEATLCSKGLTREARKVLRNMETLINDLTPAKGE